MMPKIIAIFLTLGLMNLNVIYAQDSQLTRSENKTESKKLYVSVLDFQYSENLKPELAKSLTKRFEVEVQKLDSFRVLERSEMDKILQEQGLQASGACDEASCSVEMGKLAGVEHLFLGNVSRVGKTYSLSVKQINVESGEIHKSYAVDVDGDQDQLLTEGCEDLARQIAGMEPKNRSLWVNPWLWTSVGVGTAAVVGTVLLTQDGSKTITENQTIVITK